MAAPETSAPPDALVERMEDTRNRLLKEFQSVASAHVIDEIARESFNAYRNVAVYDFVPLFVERETRARLQAQLK